MVEPDVDALRELIPGKFIMRVCMYMYLYVHVCMYDVCMYMYIHVYAYVIFVCM